MPIDRIVDDAETHDDATNDVFGAARERWAMLGRAVVGGELSTDGLRVRLPGSGPLRARVREAITTDADEGIQIRWSLLDSGPGVLTVLVESESAQVVAMLHETLGAKLVPNG
jgi:hypothetical protein